MNQLVVLSISSNGFMMFFIDVTLIISVLFTYPLQCFPCIEITESYLFRTPCPSICETITLFC